MAHLYIAATQKSSGKTTLSIGLARELRRRGLAPRPFKKGPDYIDPLWLAQASGQTCFNLDFHTMARAEIHTLFARQLGADLGLIEGNVGLFDDVDIAGSTSNAELAKLLGAPVVLVVDCHGMARGIAPLLLGYQAFDRDLRIAGVILNKVGSARHAGTLRRAVEHFTDLPVLGLVRRAEEIQIAERHLGLIPVNEAGQAEAQIEAIRAFVADQVDVEAILAVAATAAPPAAVPAPAPADRTHAGLRIGIARDEVFGFYYPDDLLAFAEAGAELVDFSPLHDADLPPVDALFIGGGFPECRMADLEANRVLRAAVADFAAAGRPVYAECGGLMYLCRGLHWGERRAAMCGVLAADVAMHARPRGHGYVRLRETEAFPWSATVGREVRAHEFHHSALVAPAPDWRYAYAVERGTGLDGRHDGIVQQRVLACYSHLRGVGGSDWPRRFLAYVAAARG
ncbi:cobyrinate a,c-diamide synthase [Thiococcus pfennigii]|uniref:cobyrinate a,c-diamide synthase n=1 Tax=Thiococcus pfennigii TaxID=1057 RepID=UPI00190368EB|nr:cobyrinate a,c-diamide synthase [Thiococcus pfennigii]MBK1732321.1 cobyrinic acid a,c-diamide synthase [Thiococcus pfennigii]